MAEERVRWPSVVDRAREIVHGYAPMQVTLRQVMYRLVSEGTLPHTAPMYRRLSAQLALARREGRFPDLIDTVREQVTTYNLPTAAQGHRPPLVLRHRHHPGRGPAPGHPGGHRAPGHRGSPRPGGPPADPGARGDRLASAASGERRLSPPRTTAPSRLRGADPPSATRPPCARCRTAPAPTPCSTASATPWPSAPGPVPPPRLARAAARHADAEAGLRAEYDHCAAARTVGHDLPCAAAVVAVHVPGGLLSVAWSGDARACLLLDGHLRLLTEDHNARRVYDDGDRNLITSCLGEARSDEETERLWGHPAIEYLRCPTRPGRLLLASDGAYEPHEDAGRDLAAYLTGDPRTAAERLVDDAVRRARALPDPYADNATALIARITC